MLKIVTPERTVYAESIVSLVAPGVDGYFGVLAHHAAMLAEVGVGRLTAIHADGSKDEMAVAGGFLEVGSDATTVLADSAERKQDIDVHRAEAALQRAKERLAQPERDIDMARAEAALTRALNRMNLVHK
jgi:F-type H+-transporting ATPase subunit epsilon